MTASNLNLMKCEYDPNLEAAVIQQLVEEPAATAEEIADYLGCEAEHVRHTRFYRRVLIARIARDPDAVQEIRFSA